MGADLAKTNLYTKMQANPFGDWNMRDVENVCQQEGIDCQPPTGGGPHFKVSHPRF